MARDWFVLALLVVALGPTPVAAQTCGDCNGDGTLTILDALTAAQISAAVIAEPMPFCFPEYAACNAAGDLCPLVSSVISILDALLLAQAAAGLPVTLNCGAPLGLPPSCAITQPSGGTVSGDVSVIFDLVDPDSGGLIVELFFSSDAGVTFNQLSMDATSPSPFTINPTSAPPQVGHLAIWDSLTDIGAGMATVILRIDVDDGTTLSTCVSPSFVVDNASWMACIGAGVSILQNPGFEAGSMTGWSPTAFQIDTRPHDGAYSSFCFGNNPLIQSFTPVPCSQITRFTYWGRHPNESVFGVTYLMYTDGTMTNVIHPDWNDWTFFDLRAQLDVTKTLREIQVWGYSGGGPGVDETIFDSFELCYMP